MTNPIPIRRAITYTIRQQSDVEKLLGVTQYTIYPDPQKYAEALAKLREAEARGEVTDITEEE